MWDVYLAIVLQLACGALLGAICGRVSRHLSRHVALSLAGAVAAALVAFVIWAHDAVWIAHLLPIPSVVVLGDLRVPLVAILAGLTWRIMSEHTWRRIALIAALVVVGLYRAYAPIFAPVPECRNLWRRGIIIQTTPSTCVPAAAARLLAEYDIRATESDMAQLCLTRERGTSLHGLYRGLAKKTTGTPWRVEVRHAEPAELGQLAPLLMHVGLTRGARADPRYEQLWGWTPGLQHMVLLFAVGDSGRLDIGDPSIGREQWEPEALDVLWDGVIIRLVRR